MPGEVLEAVVTAERDKAAALKLLKRIMKKYGAPRSIVTDGLRTYSAAMNEIGVAAERHEAGGRLNNRAENSHQPFRRRERAMQRFRGRVARSRGIDRRSRDGGRAPCRRASLL
jgi:putative transposase